jgi:HK97 gp10 family phage protein
MIEFKIDDSGMRGQFDKLIKYHSRQFSESVADATLKVEKLAKHKAPKDDGKLQQNINSKITNKGFTGEVTSGQSYSDAVEHGTRPHTIRIKSKQVLAGAKRKAPPGFDNFSKDWAIYGLKVQHPGTRPQPFMRPAFMVGKKILMNAIAKIFK